MQIQLKCKHCDQECGHFKTIYSHSLNKPLIGALRQLVDFYEETLQHCNLQKDLYLTKNQYNNFQKLQYFYVVRRTDKGWYPTDLGRGFIYGLIKIFNKVATIEGQPIDYSHAYWQTVKYAPQIIAVWDIDLSSYKQKVAYQEEKSYSLF